MIQIVAVPQVTSLAEYIVQSASIDIERPSRCQNPACGLSGGFWRHTPYTRRAQEGELSAVVTVERFLCKYCGLVISCLFDFLIPYVVFTAKFVGNVVQEYGCRPTSYRSLSGNSASLHQREDGETGPSPSHVQIFRWVKRVAAEAKMLLTYVQRRAVQTNSEICADEMLICPNSWKSLTEKKQHELNHLFRLLLQSSRCCGDGLTAPIEWLHRYFLQSKSFCRSILSGRNLRLSAQQRAKHMN